MKHSKNIIRYAFLLTILFINTPHIVNAQPANPSFTDDAFYECVVDAYNKKNEKNYGYDVNLTAEELSTITTIECKGSYMEKYGAHCTNNCDYKKYDITNFSGVNKLTNLTIFNITYQNQVDPIDLSSNTKLTRIYLNGMELSSINTGNNDNLTDLTISKSNLTSIDLSHNTNLTELSLHANNLTSIDLSQNTKLTELSLSSNDLTSIDLSHNTDLTELRLQDNSLTSIDLSHNTKLTYLDIANNSLTSIDLSHNTNLTKLLLNGNSYPTSNRFTTVDLSQNTKLVKLNLWQTGLQTIDLSHNVNLTDLDLGINELTTIDLSQNTKLTELELYNNNLTTIDLSHNTDLTLLNLNSNNLTTIDLSNNTKLQDLSIGANDYSQGITLSPNIETLRIVLNDNIPKLELDEITSLKKLVLGYPSPLDNAILTLPQGTAVTVYENIEEYNHYEEAQNIDNVSDSSIVEFTNNKFNVLNQGNATITLVDGRKIYLGSTNTTAPSENDPDDTIITEIVEIPDTAVKYPVAFRVLSLMTIAVGATIIIKTIKKKTKTNN